MPVPGAIEEIVTILVRAGDMWTYINDVETALLLRRAQKLLKAQETPWAYITIGHLFLRQGAYAQAQEALVSAHSLLPPSNRRENAAVLQSLAHIKILLQEPEASIQLLKQVAILEGEHAEQDAILLCSLAESFLMMRDWDSATEYFEQALQVANREDANQVFWMAHTAALLERSKLALDLLSRGLALTHGTQAETPYQHVRLHEDTLVLTPPLLKVLDLVEGEQEQEVKLATNSASVSPEMNLDLPSQVWLLLQA